MIEFFKSDDGAGRHHAATDTYSIFGFSGKLKEFQRKEREVRRHSRFQSFVSLFSSYYLGIDVHKFVPEDTREWTIEFVDDGPPTNAQVEAITCFGGIIDVLSFIPRFLKLRGPSVARLHHVEEKDKLQQVVGRPILVRVKCPKCAVNVSAKVIRSGTGSKLHCLTCKNSWC